MAPKENELVVKEETALVEATFMDEMAGQGYENMTSEDYVQAFIKILQPLSPQCMKGKDEYMEEAEPGMFYNTATNELYGTELQVIPLYYIREWTEWKPDRGGFVGKHEPHTIKVNTSDFSKWLLENGNIINDTYSFYFALPEHPLAGIVLMSFTSTNIKPAKHFNSLISMVRTPNGNQAPFFSSVWTMGITRRDDNNNTWYTIGKDKANAKRERFINAVEYNDVIKPLVDMARKSVIAYDKAGEEPSKQKIANVDY